MLALFFKVYFMVLDNIWPSKYGEKYKSMVRAAVGKLVLVRFGVCGPGRGGVIGYVF